MAIQISSCTVIDNSRNLTNIANASSSPCSNQYLLRDSNQSITILPKYILGACTPLGIVFGGGTLICKASSVAWIVAPNSSEVSRTWYCRNDANTRAQSVSGCTGWFVPTCAQLLNPGYCCRRYWDSFSSACYWSSTDGFSCCSCPVNFSNGTSTLNSCKTNTHCVRAFRCVTY